MSEYLNYVSHELVAHHQHLREGEQRVADVIRLPDQLVNMEDNLREAKAHGVRYVILGIPEDVGPRANLGHEGAVNGWHAFVPQLLRRQANGFFNWQNCMLLGHVYLDDIMQDSDDCNFEDSRKYCARVDARAAEIVKAIFDAGLELIAIGGGHNNAYPLLKSLSQSKNSKVASVNLDLHCDFRKLEGRHSGNGFRYAWQEQHLGYYHVFGLHEQKNNAESVSALHEAGFNYTSYQDLFARGRHDFTTRLDEIANDAAKSQLPVGIELDMDTVKYMPASAYTPAAFSIEQTQRYVHTLASLPNAQYLHLAEGAVYGPADEDDLGQTLNELVYSYVTARETMHNG